MADVYDGPFGGYANVTEVITAAAQTEVLAEIDKLKALITDPNDTTGLEPPHPDFIDIPPHTADKLRSEIDALKTAIDAAPTS